MPLGFSRMALVTEKTAMFAPMPSARVSIDTAANPGDLASCRMAYRNCCINECISCLLIHAHSERSACMGSMEAARRAGSQAAVNSNTRNADLAPYLPLPVECRTGAPRVNTQIARKLPPYVPY